MALDDRFILSDNLQDLFRDKDTSEPLINGVIKFFEDKARTVPKAVYKLSGSPPNYTYVPLTPNAFEITLDAAGRVVPQFYYFPLDGDPDTTTDQDDLYFIEIFSEDNVLQDTREAWPNFIGEGPAPGITVEDSFVPNGQFLLHNDIPAKPHNVPATEAGEVTKLVTDIAPGGWTYQRGSNTGIPDNPREFVKFDVIPDFTDDPSKSPRFEINIDVQVAASTSRSLRLKFNDVNKFASDIDEFTYAFSAKSPLASSISIDLIKNFGTGGTPSAPTTTNLLGNTVLTGSYKIISATKAFGDNSSKVIGTNNDSFIELVINFSDVDQSNVIITDALLIAGKATDPLFPYQTDEEMQRDTLPSQIPNHDGSSLYLNEITTLKGKEYDTSIIGKIFIQPYEELAPNELYCDGAKFRTADCSSVGIPFSRLQAKLFNANGLNINTPVFGTGKDFFTCVYLGSATLTDSIRITNNTEGPVAVTVDATTTFTIKNIHPVSPETIPAGGYDAESWLIGSDEFYIRNKIFGSFLITPNTSLFTVSVFRAGTTITPTIFQIKTVMASLLGPVGVGKFFDWESSSMWRVWFNVGGAQVAPAAGGRTLIEIELVATDTAAFVADKVREAMNGWNIATITVKDGASTPQSSHFNVTATGDDYYVWYNKDGVGVDPTPGTRLPIEVKIVTADTAIQVAQATQLAINSLFFAVPDLRGLFIRGWDDGSGNDPDAAERFSLVPGIQGDVLGTYQITENLTHRHTPNTFIIEATNQLVGGGNGDFTTDNLSGGKEARPINCNVKFIIKY